MTAPNQAELERCKAAIEEALGKGYAPPGAGRGTEKAAIAVAAEALGIARHTLRSRLPMIERECGPVDWSLYKPATAETGVIDPGLSREARKSIRMEDELKTLRAQVRDMHRENLTTEEVRASIFRLSTMPVDPPDWTLKTPKQTSGVTGVPMTIWSDWHLGERVDAGEVNGVNEFNLKIAERRIQLLVERTIDLCVHHMTNARYPGIVVNILGDIVSGEIHQELAETNDDELFPIILWAVERIAWALKQLADRFGNVFVPCTAGNHGRMTRKPQAKRYVFKNADWLIYQLLERHFKDTKDKRVRFLIPDSNEVLYQVYGHRYMGVHGDDLGVKGGDGIIGAIGPIMRGTVKVSNSSAQIARAFDTLLMGHWHQDLWLPNGIVNNTLKGYDEYARRMLRVSATPPSQVLWFNHPRRGITYRMSVALSDRKAATGGSWVSWEAA